MDRSIFERKFISNEEHTALFLKVKKIIDCFPYASISHQSPGFYNFSPRDTFITYKIHWIEFFVNYFARLISVDEIVFDTNESFYDYAMNICDEYIRSKEISKKLIILEHYGQE